MIPKLLATVFGLGTIVFLLSMFAPKTRRRIIDVVVVGLIAALIIANTVHKTPPVKSSSFAQAVDLTPVKSLALQFSGRIKSLDSLARTQMRHLSGSHRIAGQEPLFTYLDILFRPDAYANADIVYVKKKPIRRRIADRLARVNAVEMGTINTFTKTGLIAPNLLNTPQVKALLDEMEKDLIRTARPVNNIRAALARTRSSTLVGLLKIIPPPDGHIDERWFLVGDLLGGAAPIDSTHAGMRTGASIPGLDPALAQQLKTVWANLQQAWMALDAGAVNDKLARFASLVRDVSPQYPELARLRLENWYFRWKGMTWIWIVYLAAVVPLLMSVIYRWPTARSIGIGLFVLAFGLHTASLGLRWYISGRIPNSNMFEAITASTWLAGVVAFVIEILARKSAMRNLFFLGAAVASMTATMCNHFMPATLTADIDNIMPVLHDVWLYIHTNMIILSYGLIAMAAVTALLYLRHRLGGGSPDYASVGGAGSLMSKGGLGQGFLASSSGSVTAGKVLDGATMVLMELSFVTLWVGLVMGAIWADHSWGRPWGWDPKEVFALNTFIVFLILVHVRLMVKDKGFWTAVLAVVGCGVMLFNWIVINFYITGLHSYA